MERSKRPPSQPDVANAAESPAETPSTEHVLSACPRPPATTESLPGRVPPREMHGCRPASVREHKHGGPLGVGPLLGAVGTGAIAWGVAARPEFGDLPTRLASLSELLSTDRLGASFVVDLALFALFPALVFYLAFLRELTRSLERERAHVRMSRWAPRRA